MKTPPKIQTTPPPQTISEALRKAIEASGKTVHQLAIETGVSHTVIGRFLKGERDLRLETADKLSAAVGLTVIAPEVGTRS